MIELIDPKKAPRPTVDYCKAEGPCFLAYFQKSEKIQVLVRSNGRADFVNLTDLFCLNNPSGSGLLNNLFEKVLSTGGRIFGFPTWQEMMETALRLQQTGSPYAE